MKRVVRKIFLGFLCLLLLQPLDICADDLARFTVQHDKAIFRLKNDFQIESKIYRLLLFAKTEFQDDTVWVCVYTDQYEAESLEEEYKGKNGQIENVPLAENLAVKLFEKSREDWKECFGLLKSRMNFSEISYEVDIHEKEGEEKQENVKEDKNLYILMEQDKTILPLELAEGLYGFEADIEKDGILINNGDKLFSKDPTLFSCQKKDKNGISLKKCAMEAKLQNSEMTPEETAVRSAKPTETAAPSPEPTATATPSPEPTATATPSPEPTATATPSPEPTATVIPSSKPTVTAVPTLIPDISENTTPTERQHFLKIFDGMETVRMIILILMLVIVLVLLQFIKRLKGPDDRKTMKVPIELDNEDTIDPEKTSKDPEEKVTIQGVVVNNKGRVRGNNEDNFYLNGTYMQREKMDEGAFITSNCQDPVQLYAVCDGMGGADCGEEASHRAVKELALRRQEHHKMMDTRELTAVLRTISDKINKEAVQRDQKSGTTIVMLLVKAGQIVLANVGDSRIYRFRDQKLTQISVDHSKVQRMISMGLMTPEQAKTDPSRHVITQYLGMPSDIKVSPYIVSEEELRKHDVYVLCSDGLTDMVEDSQIEDILKEKEKPQEAVQELLKAALNNGGRDNVTIMLLRVLKDAEGNRDSGKKRSIKESAVRIMQILVGAGLLATILDLVYYLV